jgi:hypothetical protein
MKLPKIFSWRLRLVQSGYDMGWNHGYEAGKIERQNEIVDLLSYKIESVDWLREEPININDVVPLVKNHKINQEPIGWK